jgi:23S rRNA pseudouridine1911/1915/1917 synthase
MILRGASLCHIIALPRIIPSPYPRVSSSPRLRVVSSPRRFIPASLIVVAEELIIIVPSEAAGARLDAFLAAQLSHISRARIQRAIISSDVMVNERAVKPSYRLRAGEEIQVELPAAAPLEAAPEPIPLEILHEDAEIIIINKPAGMVTHPGAGVASGTLANALVHHFHQLAPELPQTGGALRPGIVHRLDAGTSGLIVVAKSDRAHLHLAAQFEERRVFKSYLALVYGRVAGKEGRIDAPIGRDPRHRVKMAVRRAGEGRPALTLYRVSERLAELTLLEVEIKTGRTHQIRVHLAHLKHPVVGDQTYDGGRANTIKAPGLRAAIARLGRPFLHAARLGFTHPVSGEKLDFSAPLPEELREFLASARMLA